MADKTDHIDLDDINWDNWGDIEATGEGEWKDLNKKQKARKAVTHLKGGFVSGIRDRIFTRDGQRSYIDKALPKEYRIAYDSAIDTYDAVADIYDEASKELKDISKKTGGALKPLVDKYNSKLPRKIREPLRKWTQNASKTNRDWDETDRDEIQAIAQVNDIFAKQEANKLQRQEVIEQKTQSGILKNQNKVLIELLKSAKASRGYELEVDYVYKRKSLELQYRQFAIQRKILDVQQQMKTLHEASFEKLIHNTGLPDFVKLQNTEIAKQIMTQKVFGDAINKWGEIPSRIIQNMIRNSGKKLIKSINGTGGQSTDLLSTVVQMLTQESFTGDPVGDNFETAGKQSLNILEWLMSQKEINIPFGPTIAVNGPLARAFEKAKSNKKIVAGAQRLKYLQRYGNRKFNEVAAGGSTGHDWLDTLLELSDFRSLVGKNVTTVRKSSKNLDEAALFDIGTKKAITEIIPGYLSRIHWELLAQRTGSTKHKLMTFDHTKNRFTTVNKLLDNTKSDIYSTNRENVSLVFNDIFKKMGFNKLSRPAQEAIQRTMVLRALEGQSFDLSVLMNNRASSSEKYGLAPEIINEIQEHLIQTKGFNRTSQNVYTSAIGQSNEAFKAMDYIADAMDQLQQGITNPLEVLRTNVSRGQGQVNRGLGITHLDNEGNEHVHVAKYVAGLLGHNFTNEELSANRLQEAPKKKKKLEEMSSFERLQYMASQNNQGGTDGTGFSKGGYTGDYDTKTPVGSVHGQEYVFDANSVKRIGVETLDNIKSGKEKVGKSNKNKTKKDKKNKPKFKDIFNNVKSKTNPAQLLEQVEIILADELYSRYEELTGILPNNLSDIKKMTRQDIRLRTLLNRWETINRLSQSKLSNSDKLITIKRLTQEWDSVSLSSIISDSKSTLEDFVRDIKDDTIKQKIKQKTKSTADWMSDTTVNTLDKTKDIWNDLSSYSFGIEDDKNRSLIKETLISLTKGAFGVGKEVAKARFYGFKVIPWGLKKLIGAITYRDSFKFLKYGLWLQDGKEIKLYASGLQEGRYLNGDFNTIEKPNDIHGDIYDTERLDPDGEPTLILTAKEYKHGLFDHEGKQIVKPNTIFTKITRGLTTFAWKATKTIGRGFLNATKTYVKITSWPGRKLIDLIIRERKGKVQDPEALAQISMQDLMREEQRMTNTKLDEVIENLESMSGKNKKYNDSDGDGDRDGNAFDKLMAFRNRTAKDKAKDSLKTKDEVKEKKPSFLSKIMDMVKTGIGGVISSTGGLIGMLVKGGIMALLGTFGIKSLLGWLSGKNDQEKVNPNDPRLDPTSPQYDPDFAQPTLLQKGAGWALDKMNGLSPIAQAGIGLAGGYAAWKGGKALIKGAGKLAWKGGKYVTSKIGSALASRAAGQTATSAATTVARQGLMQTARSALTSQGLRTAGTFLARHAGLHAIRAGLTAGVSAVAGTVGLPVVLGVAAVAALGYGAYKLYKSMKKDEVMITRARMASYGYEVDNEKKVTKLLEIEGYLLEHCSVSDRGEVKFKEGASEAKIQEYFNINTEDKPSVEQWKKYFFQRFLPVFAQFLTAYKKHTGRTDLHKAEEAMSYQQMQDMLPDTLVKKGVENNPYTIMESGFAGDDKVELDKEEVFDIYASISKKLRNLVQKGTVNKRQKERISEDKKIAKEAEKIESETTTEPKKSVFDKVKDVAKTADGFTLAGLTYKGAIALKDRIMGKNTDSTTNPTASSWLSGLWNKAKEVGNNIANTLTGNTQSTDTSTGTSAGSGPVNQVAGKATITKARDIFVALAKKAGKTNRWIQSYLANMHRETGGFTVATENMNYKSAARIKQIYGKTIRKAGVSAESLVNNPERLANVVMDDRINNKGLGNKFDGDGYKFRGRGLFQITGRDAYAKVGAGIGVDLVNNPDLMNDPTVMAKAAMWYATNYKPAGGDSLEAVTKSIAPGKYQYNLDKARQHVNKYNDATINQMAQNGGAAANTTNVPTTPTSTNTTSANNKTSTTSSGKNTASANTKTTTPASTNTTVANTTKTNTNNTTVNSNTKNLQNATPPASTAGSVKSGTPWMDIAKKELGVSKPSARVGQYASETGSGSLGNNYHYCATFVRWCLKQAGCELGNTNPMAKSFKGYGQAVDPKNPPYGAVIVMHWGNGKYHVAFSGGMKSDGRVIMLGGNQRGPKGGSDRTGGVVTESSVSTSKIEYAGFPTGYTPGGQSSTGTSSDSNTDSGAAGNKPTKVYQFKVNYMDFNNTKGKGLKPGHEITVKGADGTNQSVASSNAAQVGTSDKNTTAVGIIRTATGTTSFNVQKFVSHLESHSLAKTSRDCASYVMNALNAAGIPNTCRQPSAYMYPNALLNHGFHEISMSTAPQAGDIVVNDRKYNGKSQHGHIQGFTGSRWISDFRQNRLVTNLGRMFRHASLANKTPVANKDLTKPAAGADDSKKDKVTTKTTGTLGSSLSGSTNTGRRGNYTGIGTFKTGYNNNTSKATDKKPDAGTLANAGYKASLGLGTNNNSTSPLGNLSTINGEPTTKATGNAATLKYELVNNNGKRALSFTLKDGSKFIVELDAIGPAGRKVRLDGKEMLINKDGTVVDYHNKTPVSNTDNQMTSTDIKKALDKPDTYVDKHGIVRNKDGTPALIAGKPVSVTTKEGNLTTTITRTPMYQQKIPPELQKLEEERKRQVTQTNTQKQTLAQAQEKAKLDQQRLQEQLSKQKANELRTRQIQQAQVARQSQEMLSTVNALNEQLKVQRNLLQSLQNIEKYVVNKTNSWQNESNTSNENLVNNTGNLKMGQAPGLKVKGIPKQEPMSMSK